MKVYILLKDYGQYEGGASIEAVFQYEVEATLALQRIKPSMWVDYYVEEWELS